ncbi:MAG: SRPBCC family protein [Chitinophagaceae bacterium]|nr:SRPBCC family protein [Chitinophagaceae bacterium]
MSLHTFKIVQKIPIPVKQAWDFFSHPGNLQLITPANFQFRILTALDDKPIYTGQIINYTVRPLFNIRMRWTTVITRVEEEILFIDEQQRGPFRYWQHQHFFRPIDDGTEMTDVLQYEIPGWIAGDMINAVLIKNDIKKLFAYRYSKIQERFTSATVNWPQK